MTQTRVVEAFESAARLAADRAGAIVKQRWHDRGEVHAKSSAIDLVTDVDRACEAAILEVLTAAFPEHAVLAEESGAISPESPAEEGRDQPAARQRRATEMTRAQPSSFRVESGGQAGMGERIQRERQATQATSRRQEFLWLVDPLDGTTNFTHGYPQVAISIALRRADETILGLVYDPIREELFTARRGCGALLDDRRIEVSKNAELADSLLATGFPYDRRAHADFYLPFFKAFMMRTQGIRRAGSAALDLCWVAAGRVDGFWEWKLKPWDTAAGALIVEEAGGHMSDFRGGRFDPFGAQTLATNGRIHDEMIAALVALLPAVDERRPM